MIVNEIVLALRAAEPRVDVIRFGDKRPDAPYCVVNRESGLLDGMASYRVTAHYLPGQQTFMEDYIRGVVGNALDWKKIGSNYLEPTELPGGVIADNDDKTISCDRVYSCPDRA